MAVFTSAVAIGNAVLGALAVQTSSLFVLAAVGFLTQAAVGIALNALVPKPKLSGANRGYQVTTRGSALDHQIIYGRMRTGGVVVFDETSGDNNLYLHRVIAFAGHEVQSFDEIYIDDELLEFGGFDYTISLTRKVVIGDARDGVYENQTSTVSISGIPTDEATFQVSDSLTQTEFDNLVSISSTNDVPTSGTFVSATVSTRTENSSNTIASSKYKGKIRINTHLGTADQEADADLVAESDNWTTDHRLRGIAYLYIRLEFDQDAFPNGVPDITATIKGKKVYDPRTATTAWSDNPALCIRDYLTEGYGLNEASANIDDTLVATAANVCDTTAADGETLYTCNGAFVTQIAPADILNDLLTSMGGLLWYAQGEWRMKPAYYVAPTLSFDEDDLRSNITIKTRHSRRDNFNIVKGTFRGEESNWQVTDYPEVTNVTDTDTSVNAGSFTYGEIYKINALGDTDWNAVAGTTDVTYSSGDYFTAIEAGSGTGTAFETTNAFLDADNGQESVLDLELPFTDNADEARRIARVVLERNRQQLTVSASFGLRAFQVQTGDIITLSLERFGWTSKEFEVTSWTFGLTEDQDLQVQMTLREISESVFDEIDDGAVYELDNTTLPNAFISAAPQNLAVSDGGFVADDGTYVNSFIVDWDAPNDAFASYYVLEWRVEGGSVFNSVQVNSTEYQIYPVYENVNYEIRVKAVNTLGVSSPYVTAIANVGGDVTAPGVVTSLAASGGLGFIEVTWTNPADADFNYVKVFESDDNVVGNSTEIGTTSGDRFVRANLGPLVTKYYWASAVDYSGNESAKTGPVNATTSTITTADLGPAIIEYDNFAQDVVDVFDGITLDISTIQTNKVDVADYEITVDYQQQLEDATTQLANDALQLAVNASALESRINDAGITVDPDTGSVTIQGLSALDNRVNNVEIDLDAVESQLTLTATTSYVDSAIAAASLPEATLAELENTIARVDTAEIDIDALEGAITLTSTGSLYDVNDGVLGVEALEGRITVAEGEIALKATQTELDDVETRLNTAEITLDSIDAATISFSVQEVRQLSEKTDDLSELTLSEVLGRYNDRKYLTQDVAYARQSLTADVNDQKEALAEVRTELAAQIDANQASIVSEQTVRANADSALASDITTLQSEVVNLENDTVANASAVSALDTRVTTAEGEITSQASSITQLESDLSTAESNISGNATAISSIDTRVTNAEGQITSQATEINTLSSDLTTAESNISGNASAISALDTRVTSAEGSITSQASQISTLSSDLTTAEGNISGNATAISGLDTRVTDAEGDITSQASQITSLSTTVDGNTATISQVSQSVDGIEAKYGVEIDNNGNITGYQLLSGVGGSAFNVRADQFAIFDANNNGGDYPFTVFTTSRTINGVLYPAGTYIQDAYIDNAAIVNGSIDNAKIGNLQVDTIKIAGEAVSTFAFAENNSNTTITSSTTWTNLVVLGFTDDGYQTRLDANLEVEGDIIGGQASRVAIRLVRNGTPITVDRPLSSGYGGIRASHTSPKVDTIATAQTVTYALQARLFDDVYFPADAIVVRPHLMAFQRKR